MATYTLEDGTGSVDVFSWIDQDESDWLVAERSTWTQGVYMRVVGNIRAPSGSDNKRTINAYHLRKITDFNEVTYHFLDAIHTHLYNTQGPKGSAPPAGSSNFASPGKPSVGPGGGAALGAAAGGAGAAVAYSAPAGGAGRTLLLILLLGLNVCIAFCFARAHIAGALSLSLSPPPPPPRAPLSLFAGMNLREMIFTAFDEISGNETGISLDDFAHYCSRQMGREVSQHQVRQEHTHTHTHARSLTRLLTHSLGYSLTHSPSRCLTR